MMRHAIILIVLLLISFPAY
ncbi:type I toxin-antitoxin system Ibs family toxin [Escherichia coli]|nr:type I toxin-antitoxin system Ibs family toxin [Escherichia coli]